MTESQRANVMVLMHAVLKWRDAQTDAEYVEAQETLTNAVDNMDNDTIAEVVRIINS